MLGDQSDDSSCHVVIVPDRFLHVNHKKGLTLRFIAARVIHMKNMVMEIEFWNGQEFREVGLQVAKALAAYGAMVPETMIVLGEEGDSNYEASLWLKVGTYDDDTPLSVKGFIVGATDLRVKTIGYGESIADLY